MALLTASTAARTGVDTVGATPTASTGDTFATHGKEYFIVKNGSGSPINATVDFIATLDGFSIADPVIAVAAGVTTIIGPFPPAYYAATGIPGGVVKITCSAVTDVTVKVITLPD